MSFIYPATRRGRAQRQRAIARNVSGLSHYNTDNVLTVVAQATAEEEAQGLGWYATAHGHAQEIASAYGLTVRQAAGTLAALSPQTSWSDNITAAHEAASHAANGRTDLISNHFDDACRKASLILQGNDPARILGGRKVRSFYANILHPERPGPVTVDRHAVSILANNRFEERLRTLERVGTYTYCAALYRRTAHILDIMPHQVQAISWLTWRRLHDVPAAREEF